jgi:hypothetical protein
MFSSVPLAGRAFAGIGTATHDCRSADAAELVLALSSFTVTVAWLAGTVNTGVLYA